MEKNYSKLTSMLLCSIIFFSCQKQVIENNEGLIIESKSAQLTKINTFYGPQVQGGMERSGHLFASAILVIRKKLA